MLAYLKAEKARCTVSEMTRDIHDLRHGPFKNRVLQRFATVQLMMLGEESNSSFF